MAKGQAPKLSNDPTEERMFTWRYTGLIHNRLINITKAIGMSLNRFVHIAVLTKIAQEEEKLGITHDEQDKSK